MKNIVHAVDTQEMLMACYWHIIYDILSHQYYLGFPIIFYKFLLFPQDMPPTQISDSQTYTYEAN